MSQQESDSGCLETLAILGFLAVFGAWWLWGISHASPPNEVRRIAGTGSSQKAGPLSLQRFLATPESGTLCFGCPFCGKTVQCQKGKLSKLPDSTVWYMCEKCGRPGYAFKLDSRGHWQPFMIAKGSPREILQTGGCFLANCPHCRKQEWRVLIGREALVTCGNCSRLLFQVQKDEAGRLRLLTDYFEGTRPRGKMSSWMEIWLKQLASFRYDYAKVRREDSTWQTPGYTLARGTGVCRDSATLLADWLCSAGYDARIVCGFHETGTPGGGGRHAWVALVDGRSGKQYLLESTAMTAKAQMRVPPLAQLETDYTPNYQFQPTGSRGRTTKGWTGNYERGWYFTPSSHFAGR